MRYPHDHEAPDVTGREPGDDYPGERHDAEREIARHNLRWRDWWRAQPVPFCHAAALAADTLRDVARRELGRFTPKPPPRCRGCQQPIMGFPVGLYYCSRDCFHDDKGEP